MVFEVHLLGLVHGYVGINFIRRRLSGLNGFVIQPLPHLIFRYFFLPVSISLCLLVLLLHAAPPTPEKSVTIVNQEAEDPSWKQRWDEARALVQQQKFTEAIDKYQEVLDKKPYIEEVKWELSNSYIEIEDYGQALVIIESLVETSPERIDYLVSGGEVALALGKTDLASRFFGRALALDPGGPASEDALLGLIASFTEQGKGELAIPLMEQLYQRGVLGQDFTLELGRHYARQNEYPRAAHYYSELVEAYQVEPAVRLEAADVFDKSGKSQAAAEQRELYLQTEPEDHEVRIKLADSYNEQKEVRKALPHMLFLLEKQVRREEYLLAVARIYLLSLGRTDRALQFFEQYREEFPDGTDVSSEIATLQLIVANDLLAIVENDGVWMLWRDLARLTPDRIGIYRAMADMLEQMGRGKENDLIEVLQIINIHEPEDFTVVAQLSDLFMKNKKYSDCLAFLDTTREHHQANGDYFLLRARCQEGSGLDLERLQSYEEYLQINPADETVRVKAIDLAGRLGLVDEMRKFSTGTNPKSTSQVTATQESLFDALLRNGLLVEAHDLYGQVVVPTIDAEQAARFSEELANAYLKSNRPFVAEQILRAYAATFPTNGYGYLLLAQHHLLRSDTVKAVRWLEALDRQLQSSKIVLDLKQKSRLVHLHLLLDQKQGKVGVHQRALAHLNTQLKANQIVGQDIEILIFAAGQYLLTNRYDQALTLIKRFQPKFKGEERLDSLRRVILHDKNKKTALFGPADLTALSYAEGLALTESLASLRRFPEAQILSEMLSSQFPRSLRAKAVLAQSAKLARDYPVALETYRSLVGEYGGEVHFRDQMLRLENMLGQPSSIFSLYSVSADETGRKNSIRSTIEAMDYPEAKLMWARALWSEDKWEEALDVYGLLDTELKRDLDRLIDLLQDRPELGGQVSDYLSGKDIFELSEQEFIDLLMSIDFIAVNLNREINKLSAEYYNYYRWGNIVDKEMTAKSSLKAREFYQAEIDYQKLFEEDDELIEPAYPDLATVYGRLGRDKEETELLATIKEKDLFYPELSKAAEKSIRRQQPFFALEGFYNEEEGRGGFKNITQKYLGVGLGVKPTLSQEIGFRFGRNEYGNSFSSTLAKSNYLLGNYAIQFGENTEGTFKLGFEDFDTDASSFLIYDVHIKSKLEQRVELFGVVTQNPVDDTIESLEDNIYRKELKLGLNLDYLFGLFFGFDLGFYDYNDSNEGERYNLWAAYRWFGERSSLDLTYSFLKLQNKIDNLSATAADSDDDGAGLSYWSPGDYWKHRVAALYKLELWPMGRLQSGSSSLSAMYALGYENEDNLVHEFEANIILEINQPFLVKGTFSTLVSDDYDNLKG
ncbi:MAG: tetratricopeptide repeat protein [Desulfofustis sp.]